MSYGVDRCKLPSYQPLESSPGQVDGVPAQRSRRHREMYMLFYCLYLFKIPDEAPSA